MAKDWIKRNKIEEALMDDTFKVVVNGVVTEVPALRTLDNIIGKAGVFCWESKLWEYNPKDGMYHSDQEGLEWLLDEIDLWEYHVIDQSIAETNKWRQDPEAYGFYVYGYSNPVEAGPHYIKEAFPDLELITVQERARYKGREGHRWYEQNMMLKEDLKRLIAELKAGNKEAAEYLKRVFVFFIKPEDEESVKNTISDLIDSLEGNPKINTLKLEPSEKDPFGIIEEALGKIEEGDDSVNALEKQMKEEMLKIGGEEKTKEEAIKDMNEEFFRGLNNDDDDLIFSGKLTDVTEQNKGVLMMLNAQKPVEEPSEKKSSSTAKKRTTIKINEDIKNDVLQYCKTEYFSVAAERLIADYIKGGKPSLSGYALKYQKVKEKRAEDRMTVKIAENLMEEITTTCPDYSFSDIVNILVVKKLTEEGGEVI